MIIVLREFMTRFIKIKKRSFIPSDFIQDDRKTKNEKVNNELYF